MTRVPARLGGIAAAVTTLAQETVRRAPDGLVAMDLRLLVPVAFAWVISAATLTCGPEGRLVGAAASLGIATLLVVLRRPAASVLALGLGVLGLIIIAAALAQVQLTASGVPTLAQQHISVTGRGIIESAPQARVVPGRPKTWMIQIDVVELTAQAQIRRPGARLLVFGAAAGWGEVGRGEQIRFSGRLSPARPGTSIAAILAAGQPPRTIAPAGPAAQAAERIRSGLRAAVQPLSQGPRALLPGIVLGDTSGQSPEFQQLLKDAGLTHLCAVSGSNTTVVVLVGVGVGRALCLPRRSRLVLGAFVLLIFVLIVGAEPSVLRAAVMAFIALAALLSSRIREPLPILAGTVLLLLLLDPWLARSLGFLLSVSATAGLMLLAPPLISLAARRMPWQLAALLAVPISAQACCLPILLLLDDTISLVSLPANIAAAPLVAPAMILGLAVAVVSVMSLHFAQLLAQVAGIPVAGIVQIAEIAVRVPGAQLPWIPQQQQGIRVALAVLVIFLFVLALVLKMRTLRGSGVLFTAAVSLVLLLCLPRWLSDASLLPGSTGWPPAGWFFVACDIGQGDALVLRSGNDVTLVDVGGHPQAVADCLRDLGVQDISTIVLTHFHADHVFGLAGVLKNRKIGQIVVTVIDEPRANAEQVYRLAAAAKIPTVRAYPGLHSPPGPLQWEVLAPMHSPGLESRPNNSSIVLLAQFQGLRLLLLGDVEQEAAGEVRRILATKPEGSAIDVLKVAHHGSAIQDQNLLDDLWARVAIISVGADNDYGHPAASTVAALASRGARIARTDLQGDLALCAPNGLLEILARGPQYRVRNQRHGAGR